MDTRIQKNIMSTNKLISILKELDRIDNNLDKKFKNNVKDISIYNRLLEDSNNNLFTIIKNLK